VTENDRANLYRSLLRGLANEAQDQLCAADKQHDWSPWHRTMLHHDIPLKPITPDDMASAMQETYRVKAERRCLNCGKSEVR
jgi:hypothetical protein